MPRAFLSFLSASLYGGKHRHHASTQFHAVRSVGVVTLEWVPAPPKRVVSAPHHCLSVGRRRGCHVDNSEHVAFPHELPDGIAVESCQRAELIAPAINRKGCRSCHRRHGFRGGKHSGEISWRKLSSWSGSWIGSEHERVRSEPEGLLPEWLKGASC